MKGKIFFVTGIPGTGVEKFLENYINRLRQVTGDGGGQNPPKIIGMESRLLAKAKRFIESLLGRQEATLYRMLSLPKTLLTQLWAEVFNVAFQEAEKHSSEGSDVFLAFHAVWYHHRNREYISAVDLALLSSRAITVDAVITLIDDIYEIRSRLSRQRGLFENRTRGLDPLQDIVLKLLRILDWRAFEQLQSEKIASLVSNNRQFVFAVKHPFSTFRSLVKNPDTPKVYIAHPISEIRRIEKVDRCFAERWMGLLKELPETLGQGVVVFEPTTIDEYRFIEDGDGNVLPCLARRWPTTAQGDDLICDTTTRIGEEFGTDWGAYATKCLEGNKIPEVPSVLSDEYSAAKGLMAVLADEVYEHISARDHRLVSQSDCLAVFRPFFNGNGSRGVEEELKFHNRLRLAEEKPTGKSRIAVVLHPQEDDDQRKKVNIWNLLVQQPFITNDSEKSRKKILKGIAAELDPSLLDRRAMEVGKYIVGQIKDKGLGVNPGSGGAMGETSASRSEDFEENVGEWAKSALEDCYLRRLDTEYTFVVEESLDPKAFATRVRSMISN